ncbi:MAG: hypothetical protein ABIP63_03080 [Thermoanaerobaculia bacterium]
MKRFFSRELANLGYQVVADPMFTGSWSDEEQTRFFGLVQATPELHDSPSRTALFLDPDTGVQERQSRKHVSYARVVTETDRHRLVYSFDQSFSRQEAPGAIIQKKLEALRARGCSAMFYDSHARFLFASRAREAITELRGHLVSVGLPASRLVEAVT